MHTVNDNTGAVHRDCLVSGTPYTILLSRPELCTQGCPASNHTLGDAPKEGPLITCLIKDRQGTRPKRNPTVPTPSNQEGQPLFKGPRPTCRPATAPDTLRHHLSKACQAQDARRPAALPTRPPFLPPALLHPAHALIRLPLDSSRLPLHHYEAATLATCPCTHPSSLAPARVPPRHSNSPQRFQPGPAPAWLPRAARVPTRRRWTPPGCPTRTWPPRRALPPPPTRPGG